MEDPRPGAALPADAADTTVAGGAPLGPRAASKKLWGLAELLLIGAVRDVGTLGIAFPVLLSKPGCLAEETGNASVHALGAFRGAIRVGRTLENDIALDDSTVSRRHATITRDAEGRWLIVDEGSLNGTLLDQQRLEPSRPAVLEPTLTTLRFGLNVRLAFMDERSFRSYLGYLREDLERNRLRATARGVPAPVRARPVAPEKPRWRTASEEYLAASILDTVRASPLAASAYRAVLDGALVEEADGVAELVAVIARRIESVVAVEGRSPEGRWHVLWQRSHRPRPPGPTVPFLAK